MNFIALGKEAKHVCLRYRIEPIRAALRTEGHWFSLQEMPRTPWGRLALYRELRHASVVIVQRKLLSAWEVPLLRRSSKRLIFDFDDAVFQKSSFHSNTAAPRRLARFKSMVQAADLVFAGNEYLAECASQFTSSEKIVYMPTCIDVTRYPQAQHARNGNGVRLVWIGSASTLRGLEQQSDLWTKLSAALPGLEFTMVSDRFPRWPGVKIVPIPWSESTEAHILSQCDIGLAWLPDDAWSQGKCGLKVLQYQAAGLPVVTNPAGVNRHMVKPGVNGEWATTVNEWIDAVGMLMHNPVLRQQMGQAGRQSVEARFSIPHLIARWKAALHLETTTKLYSPGRTAA